MTRIIEHSQDAHAGEQVFELRVFQLHDGDVRACIVPSHLAMSHNMMDEKSEPVAPMPSLHCGQAACSIGFREFGARPSDC
jgi:hypothetical protein